MQVVRRLRRRPDRQLAVLVEVREGRVLLHRQVRVALEEDGVLAHVLGALEAVLHVAELEVLEAVDVAAHAVVVQPRLSVVRGLVHAADRPQLAVLDVDEPARVPRGLLLGRRDRDDGVADEAHLVGTERVLVLAHRQDAERRRHVLARQHALDAGQRLGLRGVDLDDLGVRHGAAQQLHVQHARQRHVVGELRQARDLAARVDLADRLADVLEVFLLLVVLPGRVVACLGRRLAVGAGLGVIKNHRSTPCSARRPHRASAQRPARSPRRS